MDEKGKQEAMKCIEHFSHPNHTLKEVHRNNEFNCQLCKWEGEGKRYRCEPCNFDIHTICGTLPKSLTSFAHPEHELPLKPKPNLFHKCRLCGETVKGMVYRCEEKGCKFFLHPLCSQLPELLEDHPKHPLHRLRLSFLDCKKCDVCKKTCKSWRYHCDTCDVHIHIECLSHSNFARAKHHVNPAALVGGVMVNVIAGLVVFAITGS